MSNILILVIFYYLFFAYHYYLKKGRLAMLGIVVMLLQSYVTQTPVLDVINNGLGGLLF